MLCDISVDANNDGAISPGYNGDEQGDRWWGENPPDDDAGSPGKLVPLGSDVEEDAVPIALSAWCDIADSYLYNTPSASRPYHFDNEGPSLTGYTHRITISEPDCVEVYDGGYNRLYPVDGVLELTCSPGSLLIIGKECGEVTLSYDVLSPADEVVATDVATLTVIEPVDLDVDSDNNNGLGAPDRTAAEDAIETDAPGKIVLLNDENLDNDGVPDYADGYDLDGIPGNADDAIQLEGGATLPLVPIVIKVDPNLSTSGMTVEIAYEACDPLSADCLGATEPDGQWFHDYPLPSGDTSLLRLWTTNAGERNPQPVSIAGGQYVAPGTYLANDLGFTTESNEVTLYVEGVTAYGAGAITVTMTSAREYLSETEPISDTDTVEVTVVDVDVDVRVDSNNDGAIDVGDDCREEEPPGKMMAVEAGDRQEVQLWAAVGWPFDPSEFTFTLDYDDAKIHLYTIDAVGYDPEAPEAGLILPGEITDVTPIRVSDLLSGAIVYMDGIALGGSDITVTATKIAGPYAGSPAGTLSDTARVSA